MSVYNIGMSDDELIARYKSGDVDAFESLLSKYKFGVFNYILKMVGNRAVADDIFQDVWLNVLKAMPRYRGQGKFSAFLFKIANTKSIDYLRKVVAIHELPLQNDEPVTSSYSSIENDVEKSELLSLLNNAVLGLPVKQKEVFLLRQETGLSFKEIALLLGCPLNTVLARMHNAVINLRKALKEVR